MTHSQDVPKDMRHHSLTGWLIHAIPCGVLVLAFAGCGQSQVSTVIDHSSPEGLFAGFCRAIEENADQSLIEACDPPLRPAWTELLEWNEKRRRADVQPLDGRDILEDMKSRFCGDSETLFERVKPDMVLVRNAGQAGQVILRERGGKWYVGFDGEIRETEYRMKLATEIIKSELGERSLDRGSVMEAEQVSGG